MNRLPFRLPEFTRLAWVSPEARNRWQPSIERSSALLAQLEVDAVVAGLRSCALQAIAPESRVEIESRLAPHGLVVRELERIRAGPGYASAQQTPRPGEPFRLFAAIGAPGAVDEMEEAWQAGHHDDVGRLLGYPSCCSAFFRDAWVERGHVDTTWPMVRDQELVADDVAVVSGPPQANILLRWLGVRAVSHLPCRFDCVPTVEVADRTLALARHRGLARQVDELVAMLSWPVEWTALHGIAEIRTPVVKIIASTDATAAKLTVRRPGDVVPEHGAQGLAFPYATPGAVKVTLSRRFSAGIANPIEPVDADLDTTFVDPSLEWADNGFAHERAMQQAHVPLVDTVRRCGPVDGAVLDLGCGNGRLLRAVCDVLPALDACGVDVDADKIERARARFDDASFVVGDLFDVDVFPWGDVDIAILMAGRLREAEAGRAAVLRRWLADHARHLVVYSYEPGVDLAEVCGSVGLDMSWLDASRAVGVAEVNDAFDERIAGGRATR